EKYYRKPLDIDYILPENFENFENIKNMLEKAMK
ncbi:acyl carrier protein, partial [Campylobacter peloridis]|nr:acyl carrier protein [Campylobacter peloridis]